MLTEIRERATGIVAWIIVIIISIPFALWGINTYFEGGGSTVVASVGNVEIDANRYQSELSRQRQEMARLLRTSVSNPNLSSPAFKRNVLNGMLERYLLEERLVNDGYSIGDQQLNKIIQSQSFFQVNNKFDHDRYQQQLRSAGLTAQGYEQQQRIESMREQLARIYEKSNLISSNEVERLTSYYTQNRLIDYVLLKAEDYLDQVEISSNQVEKFYQDNRNQYQTPAQIKVAYIEISMQKLMEQVTPTEAELESLYHSNQSSYRQEETRRISHILLEGGLEDEEVKSQIHELYQMLNEGADFSDLAKQFSADSGSSQQGGDLGWVTRGTMDSQFENAAFAITEIDEVSKPVQTGFGWHLIKLTELNSEAITPFVEVRTSLIETLKRQEAEAQFADLSERLATLAFEFPESLEPAGDNLSLPIQESDWFSVVNGSGIASDSRLRKAAFADDVSVDNLNSELFEINTNHVIVMRKADFRPAAQLEFADVEVTIRQRLELDEAMSLMELDATDRVKDLQANNSGWDDILTERNWENKQLTASLLTPSNTLPSHVTAHIFTLATPTNGRPVYSSTSMDGGQYLIINLRTIKEHDDQSKIKESEELMADILVNRYAESILAIMQKQLINHADITIFEDQL